MKPFRIPSKLDTLKMAVRYARAMKTLRDAAKPEDTPVTEKSERPQKPKGKNRG